MRELRTALWLGILLACPAWAETEPFRPWQGVFERETAEGGRLRERWWAEGAMLRGEGLGLAEDGQWVVEERMLVVEIGSVVYLIAHPLQNPYPVAFELIFVAGGEATFENRGHDFPTRIGYRADEMGLYAWIAGADGARIEFEFRRVE